MLGDQRYGFIAPLGFTDHAQQAYWTQHHLGKTIHARGRGRTSRPYRFVGNRIHRAHVINKSIGKIYRQGLSLSHHGGNAFMRGIATG